MHFQRPLLLFVASNSGKKYSDWTLPRIRAQKELSSIFVWLQNEHERQFCEEFAPHPGGTNDNDDYACEPNNITVQNKIIAKILPVNKFTTLKFLSLLPSMNGYFFSWLLCFALQYMFIQICSQTWASLSFVPPRWGANSSQSCRPCSFSGHKQRCSTVLQSQQRTAGKAVEDALQYIKMYM